MTATMPTSDAPQYGVTHVWGSAHMNRWQVQDRPQLPMAFEHAAEQANRMLDRNADGLAVTYQPEAREWAFERTPFGPVLRVHAPITGPFGGHR